MSQHGRWLLVSHSTPHAVQVLQQQLDPIVANNKKYGVSPPVLSRPHAATQSHLHHPPPNSGHLHQPGQIECLLNLISGHTWRAAQIPSKVRLTQL
eukprot:scaffold99674_cov15-Tisochrysis_lutea.AAC.2